MEKHTEDRGGREENPDIERLAYPDIYIYIYEQEFQNIVITVTILVIQINLVLQNIILFTFHINCNLFFLQ